MKAPLLIPSYKPEEKLIGLVKGLSTRNFAHIVIVDDGGGETYRSIFDEVAKIPGVHVIHHDINLGKGAALKTGFKYIYNTYPESVGVVTADADGQHKEQDIVKVAKTLETERDALVLGARVFSGKVPLRSALGNKLTRKLFKLIFRLNISDTQTGLRGIPRDAIPMFLSISYNHYEYETEMLLVSSRNNIKIVEVPIETVYENNNEGSHFNPLVDSIKIYFVLLRYTLASLLSALVDFTVFISIYPFIGNILYSTYTARFVSLFVNYNLVNRKVFGAKNRKRETFPKYILLVIISGFLSSGIIYALHATTGIPVALAKILAESLLYIVNFYIQKKFIFTRVEA